MNKLLIILSLFSITASAQRLPSLGLDKVRVTEPGGRTLVAELKPAGEPNMQTDRSYYWYSGNAIRTTQGGFSGKLLNGKYQEFYGNKALKEQGEFKKGLKSGVWKSWNESGVLNQTFTWNDGQKDGDFELFDEQGQVKQSGRYNNDLLNGKLLIHHGKDSVQTVLYKDGKVISPASAKPSLWKRIKSFRFKKKAANSSK